FCIFFEKSGACKVFLHKATRMLPLRGRVLATVHPRVIPARPRVVPVRPRVVPARPRVVPVRPRVLPAVNNIEPLRGWMYIRISGQDTTAPKGSAYTFRREAMTITSDETRRSHIQARHHRSRREAMTLALGKTRGYLKNQQGLSYRYVFFPSTSSPSSSVTVRRDIFRSEDGATSSSCILRRANAGVVVISCIHSALCMRGGWIIGCPSVVSATRRFSFSRSVFLISSRFSTSSLRTYGS